jgi:hypothetical protein
MVALLLGLLLATICLGVVALPFFRRGGAELRSDAVADAYDVPVDFVSEVRRLASEHELGEITAEELAQRRDALRLAAAQALKDRDDAAWREITAPSDVEAQVLARRKSRARTAHLPGPRSEDDSQTPSSDQSSSNA